MAAWARRRVGEGRLLTKTASKTWRARVPPEDHIKCSTTLLKKNFQICPTSGLSHLLQIWFNDAIRLDCIEWICTPFSMETGFGALYVDGGLNCWSLTGKNKFPNQVHTSKCIFFKAGVAKWPFCSEWSWNLGGNSEGWTTHLQEETQSQHLCQHQSVVQADWKFFSKIVGCTQAPQIARKGTKVEKALPAGSFVFKCE